MAKNDKARKISTSGAFGIVVVFIVLGLLMTNGLPKIDIDITWNTGEEKQTTLAISQDNEETEVIGLPVEEPSDPQVSDPDASEVEVLPLDNVPSGELFWYTEDNLD